MPILFSVFLFLAFAGHGVDNKPRIYSPALDEFATYCMQLFEEAEKENQDETNFDQGSAASTDGELEAKPNKLGIDYLLSHGDSQAYLGFEYPATTKGSNCWIVEKETEKSVDMTKEQPAAGIEASNNPTPKPKNPLACPPAITKPYGQPPELLFHNFVPGNTKPISTKLKNGWQECISHRAKNKPWSDKMGHFIFQ
jgi:hypothetical protein